MDLDSFEKDYRAFKARVTPMLEAWEKHESEKNAPEAAKLDAQVSAPLPLPDDATDEQKAAHAQATAEHEAAQKLKEDAAHAVEMTDEEKKALDAAIHAPLPPPDPNDPTVRKVVAPEAAKPPTSADATGPTVQEWVASGYKASNYPPYGYASRSTPEEIAAAVKDEEAAAAAAAANQPNPANPANPPTAAGA
jgi:hypothetical protein